MLPSFLSSCRLFGVRFSSPRGEREGFLLLPCCQIRALLLIGLTDLSGSDPLRGDHAAALLVAAAALAARVGHLGLGGWGIQI